MRDDEGRAPRTQPAQAILDHLLTLAVERRRRLIENEDARIGEDGARDRDPLPLPTG